MYNITNIQEDNMVIHSTTDLKFIRIINHISNINKIESFIKYTVNMYCITRKYTCFSDLIIFRIDILLLNINYLY